MITVDLEKLRESARFYRPDAQVCWDGGHYVLILDGYDDPFYFTSAFDLLKYLSQL